MKKLILLIVVILILPALLVSDTLPTDSSIPDNEMACSQTQASNSSEGVKILIMMTGVLDE